MSWKGFKKAMVRLPQQIMSKAGYAEETHDDEFERVELTFKEFEQSVKQLTEDAKSYKQQVKNILDHQKGFATALQVYYEMDETGHASPMLPICVEYGAASAKWGEEMNPWMDAYLQKVIVMASEGFLGVVKGVRATVDKRNRKLIDHDRWLTNVKKAQEANDKAGGAKIAEVTKAESQFDLARQEYEAINTKIKEEMPMLMALRPAFVDPILQTIVIFGVEFMSTGTSHLTDVIGRVGDSNDIEADFKEAVAGPMAAICELKLVNPRLLDPTQEARDPTQVGRPAGHVPTSTATGAAGDPAHPDQAANAAGSAGPLPTKSAPGPTPTSSAGAPAPKPAAAPAKAGPPPIASKPGAAAAPQVKKAVALYPYQSETDGDLQFDKDDVIEILTMTASQDDWWSGRLHGKEGFFPANYVQLM